MKLDGIDWAGRPWRHLQPGLLGQALSVPTMLTMDEALLYYWLAVQSEGLGAVIDLGTHRGGSAARLLAGLAAAGVAAPLFSYGRFGTGDGGENLLDQVGAALAPWGKKCTLVQGDIAMQSWKGGDVEILAVDAAKTSLTADRIAEEFFPALIPWRSVLIQQDFLHVRQPWLAAQMASLADSFSLVGLAGDMCAIFVPTRPITPEQVAQARTAGLDDAGLTARVSAAEEVFSPMVPRQVFQAQRDRIRVNPGVRQAWRMNRDGAGVRRTTR